MIKVAVVGLGGMGGVHYREYQKLTDVQVIAVADVRRDMAAEKVTGSNVNVYDSIDELLANETPDVIDICTPSYLHAELSIKALQAGCHVLCEKPMSISSAETEKIIEAANKSGKLFMTAHVVRFMPEYVYLKQVIDSKELGDVVSVNMRRLSEIPRWSWQDWMRDAEKSGGVAVDLSIHDIDYAQYVFGEPKEISCVYHKLKDDNDYVLSTLIYDGFCVRCEGAWYNCKLEFSQSFLAVFQNGTVELKDNKLYKNGVEVTVEAESTIGDTDINIKNVGGYGAEIEYFIACVKNNTPPIIVTPESSHNSVKLVEKILDNAININ